MTRDVELHGQSVPEGSIMVLLNGSANRDERHFPDGDSFDIHRDIGRHQSFGYGIHLCLGWRWPAWRAGWRSTRC